MPSQAPVAGCLANSPWTFFVDDGARPGGSMLMVTVANTGAAASIAGASALLFTCTHVFSSCFFAYCPLLTALLAIAGRRASPPAPQSGGVYPNWCGENTGQNALPPATTAWRKNSALPESVLVQILLLVAWKGRSAPAAAAPSPHAECKEVQY